MTTLKTDLDTADALFKGAWNTKQPGIELKGQPIEECLHYQFPKEIQGDYHFEVLLYDTLQEASIRAVPYMSGKKKNPWNFFWYRPYEIIDYASPAELVNDLCKDLHMLLTQKSRIQQERSLFLWTFHASTWSDNSWNPVYSVGCLRRKHNRVPLPEEASYCYQSEPAKGSCP